MSVYQLRLWAWVCLALLASMMGACTNQQQSVIPANYAIDKTSDLATNVVDKSCKNLVLPFQLEDNFSSLAIFLAKEKIPMLMSNIPGVPGLGALVQSQFPNSGKGSLDNWDTLKNAAKQLNWLPMDVEVYYGEALRKDTEHIIERDSKQGKKLYPIADEILKKVLASIGQKTDYHFQLFILGESQGNAIAQPGGFIYLDADLVKDPSKHPKAYFALSHEISHVLQRHQTLALQSVIVDAVSANENLIDALKGIKGNPLLVLKYLKASKDSFIRYGIDQELQADSCAVRLLSGFQSDKELKESLNVFIRDLPPVEQKKTPENKDFVTKLQDTGKEIVKPVTEIVSSPLQQHPNTEERVKNLQQMVSETSGGAAKVSGNK